MEKNYSLNANNRKLIIILIALSLYYNFVECFITLDRLRHISLIRYPMMNLRLAFAIYPIIAFYIFIGSKIINKTIYYSALFVICAFYSTIVIQQNISHFPIKIWGVFLIFVISVFVCVFINYRIDDFFSCHKNEIIKKNKSLWNVFLSALIIIAIIITTICHTYII